MKVGVTFPQIEIGNDPHVIKDYAQAAEDLGYNHLLVFDHVLGADPTNRPGWRGSYSIDDPFHEPFVLFGYLAAVTQKLELVTGVIILPQRQTALVAKQAAEVDVLTGGRLRLGVGVGWNEVEYEALGMNFHNRGRRIEEQVEVLRLLWTQKVVTFHGKYHHITEAGINPLPVQRPIPLWMGGSADVLLRRAARMADGWFPQMPPNQTAEEALSRLRAYLQAEGRDPNSFGLEARITIAGLSEDDWVAQFKGWEKLGATHISVNTMRAGLSSPQDHINAIRRFKEVIGF
ncbi:Luciferase-like monooxygenase [Thermobaculum terrenum ATCC BAA-798]|uniref:Luciferase-like monooxygenase n=1 Tax=Thermobaculum terrenum (strain ATCC BAA-798 / CCMEE 7001 / YNP1) TaxID=525904 RepID=D1CEG2_THET1|nr:LLM class F420-dependent oxidoreductase [Thermobaculum terrenum]ACZ41318.1 Luciferase-like monooxygenase [Thermobaculum terrenum ATCC BAA-798]